MLQAEYWLPSGQSVLPGISLASIVAPAQMFAFGDCYDTPRFTMDMTFLLCTFPGSTNSSLRHNGGHFNVAFADGHSKSVLFKAGYVPGAENGEFARPADSSVVQDYCADPTAMINVNQADEGGSLPIPSMQCNQIGAWMDKNFPPCQNGSKSMCMMPN